MLKKIILLFIFIDETHLDKIVRKRDFTHIFYWFPLFMLFNNILLIEIWLNLENSFCEY